MNRIRTLSLCVLAAMTTTCYADPGCPGGAAVSAPVPLPVAPAPVVAAPAPMPMAPAVGFPRDGFRHDATARMTDDALLRRALARPANARNQRRDPLAGPERDPNHDKRGILHDKDGRESTAARKRAEREARERAERAGSGRRTAQAGLRAGKGKQAAGTRKGPGVGESSERRPDHEGIRQYHLPDAHAVPQSRRLSRRLGTTGRQLVDALLDAGVGFALLERFLGLSGYFVVSELRDGNRTDARYAPETNVLRVHASMLSGEPLGHAQVGALAHELFHAYYDQIIQGLRMDRTTALVIAETRDWLSRQTLVRQRDGAEVREGDAGRPDLDIATEEYIGKVITDLVSEFVRIRRLINTRDPQEGTLITVAMAQERWERYLRRIPGRAVTTYDDPEGETFAAPAPPPGLVDHLMKLFNLGMTVD